MAALMGGRCEMVELLLQHGADPKGVNVSGILKQAWLSSG